VLSERARPPRLGPVRGRHASAARGSPAREQSGPYRNNREGAPMTNRDPHANPNGRLSRRLSRRRALQTLGAGLVAGVSAPWVLRYAAADQPMGPGGIPLARPNAPVTLPRFEDPIKSGLEPEKGGTFTIFNYSDYIDKS